MLPEPSFYSDYLGRGWVKGGEGVDKGKRYNQQSRSIVVVLTMDKLTHLTPFKILKPLSHGKHSLG